MKLEHLAGAFAVVALGLVVACRASGPPERFTQKLVVLGFEGMDPRLVEQWMAEGRLPNLARLAGEGAFRRLGAPVSAESSTAWASFATGTNPGKHDIYGSIVRNPQTYGPERGLARYEPARFWFGYFPASKPVFTTLRRGTPFWVTAGEAGVRPRVLAVPVTFPPEEVPNGILLSGPPLPDLRNTPGTFNYFATDLGTREQEPDAGHGILHHLEFAGDLARSEIVGPADPTAPQAAAGGMRLPVTIRWDRAAKRAAFDVGGTAVSLDEGGWSRWVPLDFRVNWTVRIRGIARLCLLEAGRNLRVYVSPINWRPDDPVVPISAPASFAAESARKYGLFRTLGGSGATWALDEGLIDEQAFMDDLYRAFDDRANLIVQAVAARNWDLVVGVVESTAPVQYLFWRLRDPSHPMYDAALAAKFGDAIERIYRRADVLVGEVLDRVDPATAVIVLSGHGFHSFRQAVNLNTWLAGQGYLARAAPSGSGGDPPADGVDWARTRAYSLGFGQVYLNVRGRERRGVVDPGDESRQLAGQLAARLLAMRDPDTGAPMVTGVYRRDDVYAGPYLDDAPDLQVGFADGYRVSWQTVAGGLAPGLAQPNRRKWSGDHRSSDYTATPGTLVANRKITVDDPSVLDLAPSILHYFGLPVPKEMDGRVVF